MVIRLFLELTMVISFKTLNAHFKIDHLKFGTPFNGHLLVKTLVHVSGPRNERGLLALPFRNKIPH